MDILVSNQPRIALLSFFGDCCCCCVWGNQQFVYIYIYTSYVHAVLKDNK